MPSRRSLNGSEESLGSWQLVDTQARLRPKDRPVPHKCECDIDYDVVHFSSVYKHMSTALMHLRCIYLLKLSIVWFHSSLLYHYMRHVQLLRLQWRGVGGSCWARVLLEGFICAMMWTQAENLQQNRFILTLPVQRPVRYTTHILFYLAFSLALSVLFFFEIISIFFYFLLIYVYIFLSQTFPLLFKPFPVCHCKNMHCRFLYLCVIVCVGQRGVLSRGEQRISHRSCPHLTNTHMFAHTIKN